MSHGDAEAAGGATSGENLDGCGCWIKPKGDSALFTSPHVPPCTAAAAAATQHLTSLAQQLHSSLHSHQLTRLFLDDLDVNLEGEQRLPAEEVGLAGDPRLQTAKRCEFGETHFDDASGEIEGANVAKRMRTEQAVMSL